MANTVQSGKVSTTIHHPRKGDAWRQGEPQSIRDAYDEQEGK